MGSLRSVQGLFMAMLMIGAGWIVLFSLANAQVQTLAPDWVRARVLAMFMLLTEGGLAIGSLLWGAIGSRASVHAALMAAGIAMIATRFATRLNVRHCSASPTPEPRVTNPPEWRALLPGAETTALLAFRCSGAGSAGVVGCSIGCSILRRRRASRDPK